MSTQQTAAPRASLSIGDGIAMMVGLIIGVGIFKLPFLVALNVDSSAMFLGLWVLGGLITLIGALVYSELAAAYPSTGGEYHFLDARLRQRRQPAVRLGAHHGDPDRRDRRRRLRVRRLRAAALAARRVRARRSMPAIGAGRSSR